MQTNDLNTDIYNNHDEFDMEIPNDAGVKIQLNTPDDFLKIRETLERIGVLK